MEEHNEYISCIKDGKTGVCRDIKDRKAHEKLEELTTKTNEIVETVNQITGAGGGPLATDEDLQALADRVETLENVEAPEIDTSTLATKEDFNNLVNNETQIGYNSLGGLRLGGADEPTDNNSNTIAIGKGSDARISQGALAVGVYAEARGGTCIGYSTESVGQQSVAVGTYARARNDKTIQIGMGSNSTSNTLQIAGDNIYNFGTHTLTVQKIKLDGKNIKTATTFADTEHEKSKNLLGLKNAVIEQNGATVVIEGEKITVTGTTTADTFIDLELTSNPIIKAGVSYVLSMQNLVIGTAGVSVMFYDSSDTLLFQVSNNYPTYIPDVAQDVQIARASLGLTTGTLNIEFNLQIEEGTTATTPQPYNGAIVHEKDLKEALASAGGKKYMHNVKFKIDNQNTAHISTMFISDSDTPCTTETSFATALYNAGYSTSSKIAPANGVDIARGKSIIGVYANSTTNFFIVYQEITISYADGTMTLSNGSCYTENKHFVTNSQCSDYVVEL